MNIAWLVRRASASKRIADGPTGGTSHFNNQKPVSKDTAPPGSAVAARWATETSFLSTLSLDANMEVPRTPMTKGSCLAIGNRESLRW